MKSEKRSETISAMVTPSVKDEIDAIVRNDDRSRSKVAGSLLERGLELYRKDGLLKSRRKDSKLDVIRARAEEETPRRKLRP